MFNFFKKKNTEVPERKGISLELFELLVAIGKKKFTPSSLGLKYLEYSKETKNLCPLYFFQSLALEELYSLMDVNNDQLMFIMTAVSALSTSNDITEEKLTKDDNLELKFHSLMVSFSLKVAIGEKMGYLTINREDAPRFNLKINEESLKGKPELKFDLILFSNSLAISYEILSMLID